MRRFDIGKDVKKSQSEARQKPQEAPKSQSFQAGYDGVPQFVRDFVFENFRPGPYPDMEVFARGLRDYFFGNDQSDKNGQYLMEDEFYAKAMGVDHKPKYLVPSKYKPSKSKDPNAEYFTFKDGTIDYERSADLANELLDRVPINGDVTYRELLKQGKDVRIPMGYGFDGYSIMKLFTDEAQREHYTNFKDPIQNFTIGFGSDEKGDYMSIYDKYDFNEPFNSFVKPFEIYDRVYYKDNPNKSVRKFGDLENSKAFNKFKNSSK